jgi:hypothetical protein
MVLGSLVFDLMASGKQSDLDKKCPSGKCDPKLTTKAEVESLKSSGATSALLADILLFGGIAVGGTGAVLFILDQASGGSESDSAPATTASLACIPGACSASVSGRF